MIRLRRFLTELRRYPSALAGIIIILLLLITSIVVPIMTPYSEALRLWRGGEDIWAQYPRNAWPVWYNLFVEGTLPETIVFDSSKEDGLLLRLSIAHANTFRQHRFDKLSQRCVLRQLHVSQRFT